MFIYKITNLKNNKVYIGQTIRPIEQRFRRHISDAINDNLDTHFARAIRKYGPENFAIEQIDYANNDEELLQKEQYWIKYYNAYVNGYNETNANFKCGGNTYMSKSEEEMESIKNKIRLSKIGSKNPNSKPVKCLNTITGEELIFNSGVECQKYFGERTHRFITTRVTKQTKGLYKGIWNIAYLDDDYSCEKVVNKRGIRILVENLENDSKQIFESIRLASRKCNINIGLLQNRLKSNKETIIDNLKFTLL